MGYTGYHEEFARLDKKTVEMHRAITSLIEELEAIDWYNQRVSVCEDKELKAILVHNRDEEIEHTAMLMEWIRRQDTVFQEEMKEYLFTKKKLPPSE